MLLQPVCLCLIRETGDRKTVFVSSIQSLSCSPFCSKGGGGQPASTEPTSIVWQLLLAVSHRRAERHKKGFLVSSGILAILTNLCFAFDVSVKVRLSLPLSLQGPPSHRACFPSFSLQRLQKIQCAEGLKLVSGLLHSFALQTHRATLGS